MGSLGIPDRVLDDACLRFLTELDSEDLKDSVRVFFKIEEAHWFYLDHYCEHNPLLPRVSLRDFCLAVCTHVQYLHRFLEFFDDYWKTWRQYKASIPTAGAILLDETLDYVLVVESFPGRRWGFPKGKKNSEETMQQCAVREVLEETGFDISLLINSEEYLELSYEEQFVQLYIVHGISKSTKFEPRTRGEVKSIQWMTVKDLPGATGPSSNANPKYKGQGFFMIRPFINPLRKWIDLNRKVLIGNAEKYNNIGEKLRRPSLVGHDSGQMLEFQGDVTSPEVLDLPLIVQKRAAGKSPKKSADLSPAKKAETLAFVEERMFLEEKRTDKLPLSSRPKWPLIEFEEFCPQAWKPGNIQIDLKLFV